jgi:hypothetical protein
MKWVPKWKGFVNGIVTSGFSFGSLVFNFVQTGFVNPDDLLPETDKNGEEYFTDTDLIRRVPYLFLLLGGSYAAMILIGSLLLTDPPESYDKQDTDKSVKSDQQDCHHEVDENVKLSSLAEKTGFF